MNSSNKTMVPEAQDAMNRSLLAEALTGLVYLCQRAGGVAVAHFALEFWQRLDSQSRQAPAIA